MHFFNETCKQKETKDNPIQTMSNIFKRDRKYFIGNLFKEKGSFLFDFFQTKKNIFFRFKLAHCNKSENGLDDVLVV